MALFKNKDQLFAEPRRKLRELFAPQFVSPLAGSPEPKPFLERAKELFLPKPEPEEFISPLAKQPVFASEAKQPIIPQPAFSIKIPSTKATKEEPQLADVPSKIAQMLGEELDRYGLATESARVLHHPLEETSIPGEEPRKPNVGENAAFNPQADDNFNYKSKEEGGGFKYVKNPFAGEDELSRDRGLFRINNGTFYLLLNSVKYRPLMKKAGIIDTDRVGDITPQMATEPYERMRDPLLNARMAKIIYDEYGWKAWFAAPKELRQKGK